MVGWKEDFPAGEIKPFTLLEESIVLFRNAEGKLVALADRCCHRLAPLSVGRLESDGLRCMYHGLKFADDGRCIEVPGQDRISPLLRVPTYPVVELHGAAWIWMGDPAKADESLIPPFVGHLHSDWSMIPGRMDYDAHYRLINDNLLDLSHLTYVHGSSDSFAAEEQWVDAKVSVQRLERGVRVSRWIEGTAGVGNGEKTDRWTTYDFLVPGIFLLRGDTYPLGTAEKFNRQEPDSSVAPLRKTLSCQAVTPLTEFTSCYFFAFGPWSKEPDKKELFLKIAQQAFSEDKVIVEAQQRTIRRSPGVRVIPLAADQAIVQFNKLLEQMMEEEARGASAPVEVPSAAG
ncbi:aromatic ring-hydroxylating dioxygenase subunit alpha [Pseudomonas sp. LS1212]|uniref:aromatic ring-hydroxylating dioxygenase subunit alpha n=1 Tax=Pseudomonas sp. LS1212 TaxID=2972478 RepID=UPI00215C4993|nr:aromatic ring-hydroxylating dioxygenase subunit alpha [Pseudomonas sp. LS1212]UVJ45721.1 aromatic ring-hydroxylating dioxygenase subunit alpha [Pseudomonas sp. LS1212]